MISRLLCNGFQAPLEIDAALGHGRSYGVWSTVAVRSLPSIVDCGLWSALQERPHVRTFALITDIGNDLMYGFAPQQIAGWVETSLSRLAEANANIVVTRLPIARVRQLSAWRYHATRLSFFPLHKPVSWPEMLRRAQELDERITDLAARYRASVVEPALDWYSFDPIHIRWTKRRVAWEAIFSRWPTFQLASNGLARPGLPLLGHFPSEYRIAGYERHSLQPTVKREAISLYLF